MMKTEKRDLVEELHKPARKNFPRRRVIVKGIDDLWQADLVEMGAYSTDNKGFKYLLTIIDVFSKYAWGSALRSKNAKDVTNAMQTVLKLGRIPKNLQTDHGNEFYNIQFNNLMQKYSINHYSSYSVLKASVVERFNRTLKEKMWKEFSFSGSFKWIENYKSLIDEYNNSYHRTIKLKPIEVNKQNEQHLLKTVYNNLKVFKQTKFKVGDYVRISKYKHIFEKGYTPNWTTEIFKIKRIQNTNPTTFILEDYMDKTIKGAFYEREIMKTKFPNTYLVEKVLKRRGDEAYVKWLGFSNAENSWIKTQDIL